MSHLSSVQDSGGRKEYLCWVARPCRDSSKLSASPRSLRTTARAQGCCRARLGVAVTGSGEVGAAVSAVSEAGSAALAKEKSCERGCGLRLGTRIRSQVSVAGWGKYDERGYVDAKYRVIQG